MHASRKIVLAIGVMYGWTVSLLPAQIPAARIDSLKDLLAHSSPDSLRFEYLYALGNAHKLTNFQVSRSYALQSLELAKELHMLKAEGDAYNLIGVTYRQEGNFIKAKEYTLKSLKIREQLGLPKGLYQGYNNLGYIIFEGESNLPLALKYYEKARDIAIKAGMLDYLPDSHNQIGLVYKQLGKLDIARFHFLKAVELGKQRDKLKEYELTAFYNNLSKVALDQGKPAEGLQWVQKAIALNKKYDNKRSLTYSYENAGRIYAYQHKLTEAEASFNQALTLAYAQKAMNRIQEIYSTMSESYEQAGELPRALAYHKRYTHLQDSIFSADKARQLAELQVQYETRQKEEQIQKLDQENDSQTRQLALLGGGALLLVMALGGLGWQYQRIRRTKAKLQQQSVQLELLMKELHHRVKNNLAIVSGLLNLQSYQMQDKEAVEAIRRGQQRIEAMSLIHQKLYQTDKLTQINVREYLLNLIESLLRVHGYTPNDFDLQIDISDEWLDVDLMIPIGLIANELITNSLKYAYQHTDRPSLRVALQTDPALVLEIADNGSGFDISQWQKPAGSFGKQLVKALGNQIGANLNIITDNGTCFRLSIPKAA